MRVLHTYCLNYNVGDYALGMGVKNLLRSYLPIDYIGETNLQGREFNEYYINEVVNKKYDLLVIGGGGVIHGFHWPNGWFWLINKDFISKINIPFIVYGVGDNYFQNESIPSRAVGHLRETYDKALHFSVRNDGSYERVSKEVGIDPVVVPDPGFHIQRSGLYKSEEKYVIIQLANDKGQDRFKTETTRKNLIRSMQKITKKLSKKYRVLFVPHVFDDIELCNAVAGRMPRTEVVEFGKYAFDNSKFIVSFYEKAEFVIAMRGHAQIIPIGFNVPVISLYNHPKHSGLMDNLGLQDFGVDIKDGTGVERDLAEKIDLVEHNYEDILSQLRKINNGLSRQTDRAFFNIKKKLDQ